MAAPPGSSVRTGRAPTVTGGRLPPPPAVTVTLNVCTADRPPGSVAVIRIVADPSATPATVTVGPETLVVATPVLDELAV